jgi:hypothetical protein
MYDTHPESKYEPFQILDTITRQYFGISEQFVNPSEHLRFIKKRFASNPKFYTRLFLVIHNIDGPVFQKPVTISILAQLASIPQISIIATMDLIDGFNSKPCFLYRTN